MKSILILVSFFCILWFVEKPLHAEELPVHFQRQMEEMRTVMRSLQSTVTDLKQTVLSQNEVIQRQNIRINAIEGLSKGASPAGIVSLAGPSGSQGPMVLKGASGFNPEIGVIGTVQAKSTQNTNDSEGNDTIALRELELNFASVVDPFSRLDAIISFNDSLEAQNANIEEAYYTRWGLPLGFTGQIGKFRSKIGKQNLMHLHQLDTTDYPLVIRDFFGEEGLASSGARLQNNIPNPWDVPLEMTGEILRGNNGASFSGASRRPIFNTHLKTYFDVTRDVNVELGWTTLFGDENTPGTVTSDTGALVSSTESKGQDRYGVKVFGGDMTLNWFLPEGKRVKWQNELYFQNRSSLAHVNEDPWGFYSLLDYKFSSKFSVGTRFDYLEPLDVARAHWQTFGISPYVTFWQSEFADFRLQYSRTKPADGSEKTDNLVMLQADFLIGAHKHPVQ